ncbi:MAG: sedoheptulokinase [Planctomycetaceae bacterium]
MPLLAGLDLGTTKLTAIAFDPDRGEVVCRTALPNEANITSAADRSLGRSEWDAGQIVSRGFDCLRHLVRDLGSRRRELAAIGVTGQQHGTVLVNDLLQPLTPLINWQDRRGNELIPGSQETWVERARKLVGDGAIERCGCRLQSGFLATILFWLQQQGRLPERGRACFIMDLFAAHLVGGRLVCEPSAAGSSGVFAPATRSWDTLSLAALGIDPGWLPPIGEANQPLGPLAARWVRELDLPGSIPVAPALGDHQASFVGSIGDRTQDVLVNVGTGAQVAIFTADRHFAPPVELRPFPVSGNLLSNVGLPGGWSYALLEQFFREVIRDFSGQEPTGPLYSRLNELAASVPDGALGLECTATFAGTRSDPHARGRFTGVSPQNFTPAHFTRALLEGMTAGLQAGLETVRQQAPQFQPQRLVAAGNGLRENRLLARLVTRGLGLPLVCTHHCEEAAVGSALTAGVAAGLFPDLATASRTLRHQPVDTDGV